MIIDPDSIDWNDDHPRIAFIAAPCSWPAHGRRRAIQRGERLTLDYSKAPQAGDLVLRDAELDIVTYGIGVDRRNVAAVVAG